MTIVAKSDDAWACVPNISPQYKVWFFSLEEIFQVVWDTLILWNKNMIFTIASLCVILKKKLLCEGCTSKNTTFQILNALYLTFYELKLVNSCGIHKIFNIMLCTKHSFEWFCFDAWAVLGSGQPKAKVWIYLG